MTDLRLRFVFGALLLLSIYGWGALIDDLVQRAKPHRTPVARGALGLAGIVALGGILNVLHLLIGPVYLLILLTGTGYAVLSLCRHLRNGAVDGRWTAIVAITALLVLPGYLHSLDTDYLNSHDDFHAYLVMPTRIVQLGTLQPDAFSYRAAISGPGGMAFLQAPVIELFGVNASRLVDQGCGLMLMIGASATLFRRFALPVPAAIALLAGMLLLAGHALVNVTSYFTTLTLLISLVHVLSAVEDHGAARPVYAALILAGIAALKNTALPFAALLCILFMAYTWWRREPNRLRNTVIASAVTGVIVLIWYLPRILTAVHTPLLTRGDGPDQVSLSYMFWWVSSGSAWNWAYLILFLATWGVTLGSLRDHPHRLIGIFVGSAAIAGNFLMNYATGGVAITRYTQPLLLMAYLVCGTLLLASIRRLLPLVLATTGIVLGFVAFRVSPAPLMAKFATLFPTQSARPETGFGDVASCLAFYGKQPVVDYFKDYRAAAEHVLKNSPIGFPSKAQTDTAWKIQSVTAPGTAVLVHTDLPFLFDFQRNQLSVVDIGMASPAPGMPIGVKDSQALLAYLQKQNIRYIFYAYGTEAGFPASMVVQRLTDARFTPWQRAMNRRVPVFHEQLMAIASQRPRIYDDGRTLVVDLSATDSP